MELLECIMTPVERAKQWRLDNLDRYRQYQRDYSRRKRMKNKLSRMTRVSPTYVSPPEGYDPHVHGDLDNWLMAHGKKPQGG